MDKFLPHQNELGNLINVEAAELYNRLSNLQVQDLGLPYYCLEYFKSSHYKRLFFSIESSAHLLFRAITRKNIPVQEIVLMDYGAGVGSLYMLAKMIGCKVIYNDHLEDWKVSACLIATALGIKIDEYIVGNIDVTLQQLNKKKILCDIIISRNVIEHIYKLDDFYETISTREPSALIYSSTTANYYNPAGHIKHLLWHRRWEEVYSKQRAEIIKQHLPTINEKGIRKLSKATRGLAVSELADAIFTYSLTNTFPDPSKYYSNTCDPANGVWAEQLLTFPEYRSYIPTYYTLEFYPGFWDTHYSNPFMNFVSRILNALIGINKSIGFIFAPFIYVVADPGSTENKI